MDVFKLSDQQLIESYLQGNEKSFEVLIGLNFKDLSSVCLMLSDFMYPVDVGLYIT